MLRTLSQMAASKSTELVGISGKRYRLMELLQERGPHIGAVWTAMSEKSQFILKDIPKDILANFDVRILPRLLRRQRPSPLLRLPVDRIPDQRILVYNFLTADFLQLVREGLSLQNRRKILSDTIKAIAQLHEEDVVHLDIKPNNIMADCERGEQGLSVKSVQLTDLENAAHLPNGRCIKGMLAGNDNWRSPEAHFKGELNKPSDVFSFGLVCLYAMTGQVTCGPDEDFRKHESQGALPAMIRLQRLVSYFGDPQGVQGLLKHLGDEEFDKEILSMLWEDRHAEYIPYKPFSQWPEAAADAGFRHLIEATLNLDPAKRLSAMQVSNLPWFSASGGQVE